MHLARILPLLAASLLPPCAATAGVPNLETLFRAEIELAAPKLRLDPNRLDPKVALALAASGVTWNPSVNGHGLLRQERKRWVYSGWAGRWEGLQAASASSDARTEFAFALSLVLDPAPDRDKWMHAMRLVSRYGDGLDAALIGIIGAPDNVPLLPQLQYAAADALVWRCDTRHTQFWLSLTDSSDSYLRSRAIAAIGLMSYTTDGSLADSHSAAGVPFEGLLVTLRPWPISAAQRLMFEDILIRASTHGSYRVRAAAALALGLMGGEEARKRLIKLAKDSAYIVTSPRSGGVRTVVFPVREVAAAALKRYGVMIRPSGGTFSDREFRTATRGCRDVTRDTRGIKKELRSDVRFYDGRW